MSDFGFHRVIDPIGAFPQSANRLNVQLPIHPTEVLIEVYQLNIDSNSYRQIGETCNHDVEKMKAHIAAIITERGKMHNPVTNSGGMLIGRVTTVGSVNNSGFNLGDHIASLISLTLTPLKIEEITNLDSKDPQIHVKGYAILFNSSPAVKLPSDIDSAVALAALDICGASKLAQLYSKDVEKILILGAGKSGALAAFAAHDAGVKSITLFERTTERVDQLKAMQLPFTIIKTDVLNFTELERHKQSFDLTLDCLNIPMAEMAAILCTQKEGTIIYFNTATSFTRAALGAEGIGSQVRMIIGNGFYPGHAELTFQLLRKYPQLQTLLNG